MNQFLPLAPLKLFVKKFSQVSGNSLKFLQDSSVGIIKFSVGINPFRGDVSNKVAAAACACAGVEIKFPLTKK